MSFVVCCLLPVFRCMVSVVWCLFSFLLLDVCYCVLSVVCSLWCIVGCVMFCWLLIRANVCVVCCVLFGRCLLFLFLWVCCMFVVCVLFVLCLYVICVVLYNVCTVLVRSLLHVC